MTTARELIMEVEAAQTARDLAGEQMRIADEELNAAKDRLIQFMLEQGTDSVSSATTEFRIKKKPRPRITDYEVFAQFVIRSGNIQLLQRRIMEKAYEEITSDRGGKPIPGTDVFEQVVLDSKPRKT
jgi:hypothetical protein